MQDRKPPAPISALLKRAIQESGKPLLAIERDTGVPRTSIMRFVRGDQFLRLDLADKLADYFDLELVKKEK